MQAGVTQPRGVTKAHFLGGEVSVGVATSGNGDWGSLPGEVPGV